MSKSKNQKNTVSEPIVETPPTAEEITPIVDDPTVTVDEVPAIVGEPVLGETSNDLPQEAYPIYIPEIPAQVEESLPVVEEGKMPLHKLNKIRS